MSFFLFFFKEDPWLQRRWRWSMFCTDWCVCRPTGPADGSESEVKLSDAVTYDVRCQMSELLFIPRDPLGLYYEYVHLSPQQIQFNLPPTITSLYITSPATLIFAAPRPQSHLPQNYFKCLTHVIFSCMCTCMYVYLVHFNWNRGPLESNAILQADSAKVDLFIDNLCPTALNQLLG